VAGCATPSGSAGYAGETANFKLTFHLDHSAGADQQRQQSLALLPLEQWYVMLLHEGRLPKSLKDKPNTALTANLMKHARENVPRLRWDLSELGLKNFLTDRETLGIICTKRRFSVANGWSFPPLGECRAAWEKRYGPAKWDNDVTEWEWVDESEMDGS
jgi:hypothetical protein